MFDITDLAMTRRTGFSQLGAKGYPVTKIVLASFLRAEGSHDSINESLHHFHRA